MVPFEGLGTVSYSHVVTMALPCIVSKIKRDIGRKSQLFHTLLHTTPPLRCSGHNFAIPFGVEKLDWC